MMDLLKKYLLTVISAAVAILALVILVLGISRAGGVKEKLEEGKQEMSKVKRVLDGVTVTGPDGQILRLIPNERVIEEKRQAEIAGRDKGLDALRNALQDNIGYDPAKKTLRRQLILDGVFPKPVSPDLPFKFPQRYKEAIAALVTKMKGGSGPTAKDIARAKEGEAQKLGFYPDLLKDELKKARDAKPKLTAGSETSLRQDTDYLATLQAAQECAEKIKVYCDSEKNLDVVNDAAALIGGRPPGIESMWWAQMSYWIQDDIAGAIAEVNEPAKNVMDAVVKQIDRIHVTKGYWFASQDGQADYQGAENPETTESFSGLARSKLGDVVQFQVDLVVDARKVPQFVDAMYRQSHYLLYSWAMEPVKPPETRTDNLKNTGSLYRYGTGPVVKLKMWWETVMFRDFYHWGIVGYGADQKTGKNVIYFYDGKQKQLDNIEDRKDLAGLMPKTIRVALGTEKDENAGAEFGSGAAKPPRNQRRSPSGSGSSNRGSGGTGDFGD